MDKHQLSINMGTWLKHNRVANGLHQREIGDLLGLTPASISLAESGQHAISIYNYLILAKHFSGLKYYAHLNIDMQGLPH